MRRFFGRARRMATELRRERTKSRIRMMRAEDAGAVADILRRSPEAVSWPETVLKETLGSEGGLELVSEADGAALGFLIGRRVVEEAEILNLAVAPGSRRVGEGTALLKAAFESFRSCGARHVFLEVRESNAAGIAFYEKHGFSKTGRREGYYRDPVEAAIVMEIRLTD